MLKEHRYKGNSYVRGGGSVSGSNKSSPEISLKEFSKKIVATPYRDFI